MVSMHRAVMDTNRLRKAKTHWFCYNSCYYKGLKTGDENDELEQKKTREFMAKYMANYQAHRKGMTPEEMSEYYTKWSDNLKYEQDLDPGTYNGPKIASGVIADIYREKRDRVHIVDVACGTGLVGEQLYPHGFKNIDGIDSSEGMLKQCKKKGVYTNLYKEFVCDKTLPIEDSVYDCLVVSGGLGESHIPCSGLYEMIRIVKSGGHVVLVMRKEYLKYVEEYMDKLEPLMRTLEREGQWELLEKREVENYSFDRQGLVFKFRVKKGLSDSQIGRADKPTIGKGNK